MEEFQRLLSIIDRLIGPQGCPWDQKQTFESMRASLLEETYEVIEAIDLKDSLKMTEELGDLLFNVIFFCKLGEKFQNFSTNDILRGINDKLIRRHPHVFGEEKIQTADEVLQRWNEIKQLEKKVDQSNLSALEGIPQGMPSLLRAQKILKKINKTSFHKTKEEKSEGPRSFSYHDEQDLGQFFIDAVVAAEKSGLNAELALNKALEQLCQEFKKWELNRW